jgi:hypothetical protein
MGMFDIFKPKAQTTFTQVQPTGSAFTRHQAHSIEVTDALAKVRTLDTLNAGAHKELDALEAEAARVHAEQDAIAARRASVLSKL